MSMRLHTQRFASRDSMKSFSQCKIIKIDSQAKKNDYWGAAKLMFCDSLKDRENIKKLYFILIMFFRFCFVYFLLPSNKFCSALIKRKNKFKRLSWKHKLKNKKKFFEGLEASFVRISTIHQSQSEWSEWIFFLLSVK